MKSFLAPWIALFVLLMQPSFANAALCAQCKELNFVQDIGTCKVCQAGTASSAFKLCAKCAASTAQCEACQADLKPKAEAPAKPATPAPTANAAARKEFPAHWGAPPTVQTRDRRPLPGGYGSGSGTLAAWIQKNLDQDAKAPPAKADKAGADAGNAAEIQKLLAEIAALEDLATRARFTPEGFKQHQDKLAALRERLKQLQGGDK